MLQSLIEQAWNKATKIDILVVSPLQYDNEEIKQQDFKSMSRKDFAEKYPKSQTAKRLKLRLKKK